LTTHRGDEARLTKNRHTGVPAFFARLAISQTAARDRGGIAMTQFHVFAAADETSAHPAIRTIQLSDLRDALAEGWADFEARPTHLVFLALIYPVLGFGLAAWASGADVLALIYPLMSGFALLGPVAAVGLYEISRRRESGEESSLSHAFDVLRAPSLPAIVTLGLLLALLFGGWLGTARSLDKIIMGPADHGTYRQFLTALLTTARGWELIVVGNLAGLIFAGIVLSLSVVSFPLLLDRDVGAAAAVETSLRAIAANPFVLAVWGLIVALGLAIGFATLFVGLAVIVPVLGHATWHLYRRVVAAG
jgi:uncharacterized membrane protein